MSRLVLVLSSVLCLAATAAAAQAPAAPRAGVASLRAARVAVPDIDKGAAFYKQAFGMQEILRVDTPRRAVILKFGTTVQEAMADPGGRVMVEQAPLDKAPDPVGHIVLNVPSVEHAVAKGVAAGGVLIKPPTTSVRPDMTRVTAYLNDPGGNMVELLEERR